MKLIGGVVVATLLTGLIMMMPGCFSYKEFTHSDTAVRLGIDNTPSENDLKRGYEVYDNVIAPIRNEWGDVRITSAYRSRELNKHVGGVTNSQHLTGEAVDFVVPGHSHKEVAEWIIENIEFDQLILEPSWIHISYTATNRNEVLTYTTNGLIRGLR